MKYGNLSRANKRKYNQAIVSTHMRRIELRILTLDGVIRWSLTPRITTGQITTDVSQSPMQVASLTFIDRRRALVFEPEDAGTPSMHRKFMVQIIDSRFIPGLGWVDCDVFTGPIWDFDRKGAEVSLVAHSVDRLAMGSVRKARQWVRKTRKTTVMRELLSQAGATRLRIPDLKPTTPVHVHVGVVRAKKGEPRHKVRHRTGFEVDQSETYWDKAATLAHSMSRLLFPTADGAFELRSHPNRPVYRFTKALLSDVDLHRAGNDGPNTFIVTGAKPKGSKRRVTSGKVGFPNFHPLSASSLAWHGKPYEIIDQTQNPHCKTKAECRKVAIRKRDRAARMVAEVSFDALPIPWLRPWDLVVAETNWGSPSVHVRQLTYPLTPDNSPMTVGSVRRATPRRRDR